MGLEWDLEVLKELEVEGVEMEPFWDERELVQFFARTSDEAPEPEPQLDRAAELQEKWGTERGQLWLIGEHRLLCGDSTTTSEIARLMAGKRANLCLTDPPYGVGWKYASTDDTQENLTNLVAEFLPRARENSDIVLLTPGVLNQWLYPRPHWVLSWFCAAGIGRNPWGFTCWQPVLAYGPDPYLKNGMGSRPDAAEFAGGKTEFDHPCPKPEGVWMWLLERGSREKGELIFDPFSGSGTTLACCEQTDRICYGMEIEPRYVAVTLQRLADMGLKPVLDTHA